MKVFRRNLLYIFNEIIASSRVKMGERIGNICCKGPSGNQTGGLKPPPMRVAWFVAEQYRCYIVASWSIHPSHWARWRLRVTGPTYRDKKPFTLTFTPTVLTDFWEGARVPGENWRICKHHTERPPPNLEPNLNQEPFCHETTVLTTAPLCHPEKADVSLVLKYTTNKVEGLGESTSVEGPGSERKDSPCRYRSYNDALCATLRWDWSISHCNEVAHRLHQWQGIYRFNLYNEYNLFLSATSSLPGMDMSKASSEQRGGGSGGKIT